jgi:Tol biopolymer transport system component
MGMEWRVWVYDLLRGTKNKFPGDFNVHFVDWAPPDGKRMVFGEWRSGISNIYWQPVDGNSPIERLTTNEFNQSPGSLSPNGETLALVTSHPSSGYDISLLQIRDRREVPFLNSRFNEAFPEISPDGRWLAYTSDETGREEVYVQSFPGKERRWPISSEGGTQPLWARSGKELFFRRSNQVWAVDFRADTDVPPGKPHLLFDQPGFAPGGPQRSYDVSLDGKGFLMVKLEERKPQPVTEMILVQNWFEELNRLVPPGKK